MPRRKAAAKRLEAGREIQQAIELMVTADVIAFDSVLEGASSRRLGFRLSESWAYQNGLLAPVRVPGSVRERAWEEINQFHNPLVSKFGDRYPGLFHAADKRCHDHGRLVEHASGGWFANSSEHPLRALYYLLLAESSQVHCYLSVAKRGYLDELGRIGRKVENSMDPHAEVKDAVLAFLDRHDDVLPPIAEVVLVHALENGLSPGDALLAVRQWPEAVGYRKKLGELRRSAHVPTVASQAEVKNYLDGVRGLGKVWKRDPYEVAGRRWTFVSAAVSGVPYVGPLVAQVVPEVAERIPAGWPGSPDQAKLFVSRWFSNTWARR